jgi:digeranylgeranylglycerophospholipid reductase
MNHNLVKAKKVKSNKSKEKIMIIGAGPIGCYCGYLLAKKGHQVDIFEEHEEIGSPVGCTGIVTKELKKFIKIDQEFLINKITKAEIFCKNKSTKIKLQEYIIDREKFDKYIAKLALKVGAKIHLGNKIVSLNKKEIIIKKIKNKKVIKLQTNEYKHIIGADGPQSLVTRKLNKKESIIKNQESKKEIETQYYIGKQAIVNGDFDEKKFIVHLGKICPSFFGWIVPENNKTARIGVAVLKNPNRYFDNYLAHLKKENIKGIQIKKITKIQSGLIPIYNPKIKIFLKEKYKDKTTSYYIVGDAAMHVKATTGGGLIPGMKAAKALTKSIIKRKDYKKELFKIRTELKMHLLIRKLLNKFKDNDYCRLLDLVNKPKIKKILAKHSRDSIISMAIRLILKEPKLIKFVVKL